MADGTDNPTVNTPLAEQVGMMADVALIRDVVAGTKRLREKHDEYLPREPAEDTKAYWIRYNRAVLYNVTERALEDLAGKPFSEPAKIEDASPRFGEWCEDIDRRGNNAHVFAEKAFSEMLETGIVHILADAPPTGTGESMADAQASGWRPYLVLLRAEDVIGWRYQVVAGEERLTQVRIRETGKVDDGPWGEKKVDRVRVLYAAEPGEPAGRWELYERDENEKNERDAWKRIGEGPLGTRQITIATAYADRAGFYLAKPPLLDLVYLNIAHFQSQSDQRTILHVGRVPILFGKGFRDPENRVIVIGAQKAILEEDPNADLKFVEIAGRAIDAGKDDLADLERRMSVMALEPLVRKTGTVTATEKAIDTAEARCSLQSWTLKFQDAFNLALAFMAELGGEEARATINLCTDFGLAYNDKTIEALDKMRARNDLSAYWHALELQRLGVLSEDYEFEEDQSRLQTESPPLASFSADGPPEQEPIIEEGDLDEE